MINSTLCYLERGDEYLMLHRVKKEHDMNRDKWIGVGGKFEEGESPEDCILRETWEETGLRLTDYRYRGLVTFVSNQWPTEYMHLFTASGWTGTPHESDEGELAWIKKAKLLSLPMWEGDKIFLRLLDTHEPFFSLKLCYEGERLLRAVLNGRELALRGAPALRLVPLTAEHLPDLTALWSDPAVIRYTNIPALCGPAETSARLDQLRRCQAELPSPTIFAVMEGDGFRGIAGCPPVDLSQRIFGLFYQLRSDAWGRGLGTAAAALALEELDRQFPDAAVLADVAAGNTASVRVLEGLGFQRKAVRPGAFARDGQTLDVWDYIRRSGGNKEGRS